MENRLPVVPAAGVDARGGFEHATVAPGLHHLKPAVANVWRTEISGEGPFDPLSGRLTRVVQDVTARSFETGPARMEARNHWRCFPF